MSIRFRSSRPDPRSFCTADTPSSNCPRRRGIQNRYCIRYTSQARRSSSIFRRSPGRHRHTASSRLRYSRQIPRRICTRRILRSSCPHRPGIRSTPRSRRRADRRRSFRIRRCIPVFAYGVAFRADGGTFRAALAASHADLIHAEFTLVTVLAVVALAAHAVVADTAVLADAAVRTPLAFFAALLADQNTGRAAHAALTQIIRAVFAKEAFRAVVALAADAVEAGIAVLTDLILRAYIAGLAAHLTADGTFRAALAAVADPVRTADTQHTACAVQLVARAVGTDAAVVADEVHALGAVLAAHIADIAAGRIAAAAFFVALAVILQTVAAVVAQLVVLFAGTAVAAVVLLVAVAVRALAAVIAVVAFPVVVAPAAAVIALHAILVRSRNRHRQG